MGKESEVMNKKHSFLKSYYHIYSNGISSNCKEKIDIKKWG